jgi:hypothetical protein
MGPQSDVDLSSECSPAVGIEAAAEKRDFGTSRRQLLNEGTPVDGAHGRAATLLMALNRSAERAAEFPSLGQTGQLVLRLRLSGQGFDCFHPTD